MARIRKQVYELTLKDLARFPVWAFALDEEGEEGQDEATVRPVECHEVAASEGGAIVRARFELADGTQMQGYLTPPAQGDTSLGAVQPIIIAGGGQVIFWCGVLAPDAERISNNYKRLGKHSATEVFPISFGSDYPVKGGPIRGAIPGFLVLEDWRSGRFRVET
jgi:hypothetical protein